MPGWPQGRLIAEYLPLARRSRLTAMAELLSLSTRTQRLLRSGTCRGTADDFTGGEWVANIHIGLRWPTRAMLTVMPGNARMLRRRQGRSSAPGAGRTFASREIVLCVCISE